MIVQTIFDYIYDERFLYQLTTTLIVYCMIRILHFLQRRRERYTIFQQFGIPGPKPSLLDGHFRDYAVRRFRGTHRQQFKTEMQFQKRYGKVYGTFMGDEPQLIVTDLDMIKKIFIDGSKSFNERIHLFFEIPFAKSILFCRYPRWKVMRRALSPFFTQYTIRGTSSTQFIDDTLKHMIDYIDQKILEAKSNNTRMDINFHYLMKTTTLHLISDMALKLTDVKVNSEFDPYVKQLDNFIEKSDQGLVVLAIRFSPLIPILQFLSTHFEHNSQLAGVFKNLNKVIDKGLNELKSVRQKDDIQPEQAIDLMIKLHHKGIITREEILANAEALLMAGYDTTSNTLTYLFWTMAKHPEMQEKVRSDIIMHGIDSKYLAQVIKETMRVYPLVTSFITRMANETVNINGWTIPKGTKVIYNNYLINNDPNIWPEPEKFDPERFRDGAVIHPCAYAPFGLGDKKCLGYNLAWLELRMITCDLLMRYRIKLISPDFLDFVSTCGTLTRPGDPVHLEFENLELH